MHSRTTSLFNAFISAFLLVMQSPAVLNAPSLVTSQRAPCIIGERVTNATITAKAVEMINNECNQGSVMCQIFQLSIQRLCVDSSGLIRCEYNNYTQAPICIQLKKLFECNGVDLNANVSLRNFLVNGNTGEGSCEQTCTPSNVAAYEMCGLVKIINIQRLNELQRKVGQERNGAEPGAEQPPEKASQAQEKLTGSSISSVINDHLDRVKDEQVISFGARVNQSGEHDSVRDSSVKPNIHTEAVLSKADQVQVAKKGNVSEVYPSSIRQNAAKSDPLVPETPPESSPSVVLLNDAISKQNAKKQDPSVGPPVSSTVGSFPATKPAEISEKPELGDDSVPENPSDASSDVSQDTMDEGSQKMEDASKTDIKPFIEDDEAAQPPDVTSNRQSMKQFPTGLEPEQDVGYFGYFVVFLAACTILFLVVQNKKRIVAMLIEGRKPRHVRRRSSSGTYRKLENNFD